MKLFFWQLIYNLEIYLVYGNQRQHGENLLEKYVKEDANLVGPT